jgi:hypothetical protein
MLAFSLGLLGLVLINHSHLSVVPQLRHAHRGHGRRYRLRTALEIDTVRAKRICCGNCAVKLHSEWITVKDSGSMWL